MIAYCNHDTPIHRLDPRVKIMWSVVVSLLAIVLQRPQWLAGLCLVTVAPWCLVRPPLARLRLLLVLAGITVLGTVVSQALFYGFGPRTEVLALLPGLSICKEGIMYGAVVSVRLLAVLSAGTMVVFTTYPSDLILALTTLRVPHSFAFMLTLALRFLPETIEQGRRILVAQQLRGAVGRGPSAIARRFRLLIVPLLTVAIRSARQVALAAEVRAFSSNRHSSRELRFAGADWAVMGGLIVMMAVGLAGVLLDHYPVSESLR